MVRTFHLLKPRVVVSMKRWCDRSDNGVANIFLIQTGKVCEVRKGVFFQVSSS